MTKRKQAIALTGAALRSNTRMPNTPAMPDPSDVEKRLTDLEVKASFTEDLVDHLNALIVRQQQQIELLMREVGKLKDRAPDNGPGDIRDARDDVPPHY